MKKVVFNVLTSTGQILVDGWNDDGTPMFSGTFDDWKWAMPLLVRMAEEWEDDSYELLVRFDGGPWLRVKPDRRADRGNGDRRGPPRLK